MSSYLGQNFLKDSKSISYISEQIGKLYLETGATAIIEIGPGKGAITKKIKDISKTFFVIEKDMKMKEKLETIIETKQIIFDDVLELDIENVLKTRGLKQEKTLIVGNLPYYITSPILRKFFEGKNRFAGGFFMIQKEVGEKINMNAGKKSYLRRLLNYGHNVVYKKTVAARHFSPAPKVDSCLISILSNGGVNDNIRFEKLKEFLDVFSPYSRKTLGKINKMTGNKFFISENLYKKRLEELDWESILSIVR